MLLLRLSSSPRTSLLLSAFPSRVQSRKEAKASGWKRGKPPSKKPVSSSRSAIRLREGRQPRVDIRRPAHGSFALLAALVPRWRGMTALPRGARDTQVLYPAAPNMTRLRPASLTIAIRLRRRLPGSSKAIICRPSRLGHSGSKRIASRASLESCSSAKPGKWRGGKSPALHTGRK